MSETITRPFTKAEMDEMRRRGEGERARRTGGDSAGDPAGETKLRQDFWSKIKRVGRKVPFAEDLVAASYCTLDPRTPARVRLVLLGAIAYFVMPLDAVADFLPFLGFADDAALIAAAIAQVAGSITDEHRARARDALAEQPDNAAADEPPTI